MCVHFHFDGKPEVENLAEANTYGGIQNWLNSVNTQFAVHGYGGILLLNKLFKFEQINEIASKVLQKILILIDRITVFSSLFYI